MSTEILDWHEVVGELEGAAGAALVLLATGDEIGALSTLERATAKPFKDRDQASGPEKNTNRKATAAALIGELVGVSVHLRMGRDAEAWEQLERLAQKAEAPPSPEPVEAAVEFIMRAGTGQAPPVPSPSPSPAKAVTPPQPVRTESILPRATAPVKSPIPASPKPPKFQRQMGGKVLVAAGQVPALAEEYGLTIAQLQALNRFDLSSFSGRAWVRIRRESTTN
ncbi:hypothetical protein ACGF5M_00790 [Gemmatimonadota bacterium]